MSAVIFISPEFVVEQPVGFSTIISRLSGYFPKKLSPGPAFVAILKFSEFLVEWKVL